jgi:hypothetical protein
MSTHNLPEHTESFSGKEKYLDSSEKLLKCLPEFNSLPYFPVPAVDISHLPPAELLLAQIDLSNLHLELPKTNENTKRLLTDILDGDFKDIAKLARGLSKKELEELIKDLKLNQQFTEMGLTITLDDKGRLVIYDSERNRGVAFPGGNSDGRLAIVDRDRSGKYVDNDLIKSAPSIIFFELSMEGRRRKEEKERPIFYPMEH